MRSKHFILEHDSSGHVGSKGYTSTLAKIGSNTHMNRRTLDFAAIEIVDQDAVVVNGGPGRVPSDNDFSWVGCVCVCEKEGFLLKTKIFSDLGRIP
jgi:hypothetical protein